MQTDVRCGKLVIRNGWVICPVCGKGTIIKGKTAYGCSRWREGCNFRKPFDEQA